MSAAMDDLIRARCERPAGAYISLVEAASFLAFGGYLTRDDLAAVVSAHVHEGGGSEPTGPSDDEDWARASTAILARAGTGDLTLYGRRAHAFGADPIGEAEPISTTFFAADLEVGLADTLHVRGDARRAMYSEIKVATDDFLRAFPDPPKARTRAPTAADKAAMLAWAEGIYRQDRIAPGQDRLKQKFPFVSRERLRDLVHSWPAHLQRERGR